MIRILKTVHGWLGVLVLPWIVMIGLTGLYLNHSSFVLGFLPGGYYDEAKMDDWPDPKPVDEAGALAIAAAVYPGDTFKLSSTDSYHGRDVIAYNGESGKVIVTVASGHYWVKDRYTRKTYAPDGRLIDEKFYWGDLFKQLHKDGFPVGTFGSLLADITAGAMILFGLSGIVMFVTPRIRRRRNRGMHGAVSVSRTSVPRPKRVVLKG
ncbi:MAG: hypothetical protein K8F59_17745 [Rhodobacteraceae bacterium]|nr:hypothetical protein [Paracoccaceae bacterium]